MAGYKREPRTIRLVFEDPDLDGLEVVARSVPLGAYMRMVTLSAAAQDGLGVQDIASMNELFVEFAEHALVSWNLQDYETGEPVPATLAGMKAQDTPFMLQMVMTWIGALGAAPVPLAQGSPNGSTSDSLSYGPSS